MSKQQTYEYVWSRARHRMRVKDTKISHHCIYVHQVGENEWEAYTDHYMYVNGVTDETPDKAVLRLLQQL